MSKTSPPGSKSTRPSTALTYQPGKAKLGETERPRPASIAPSQNPPETSGRARTSRPAGGRPSQAPAVEPNFFLPRSEARWDAVALGEVMLRLDPGDRRIFATRSFDVSEGGGEYNVVRGLRRTFGLRSMILTALVDNPVGRLVEDLMLQGGVDVAHVLYWEDDGAGRTARNGLNFTERGFGARAALGCSDRGNTAVSQLRPGDFDFTSLFRPGLRLFHTGGIFAALGAETAEVAVQAMQAATDRGARVSYDLNYRPSLWKKFGGPARAQEVNRRLVEHADILFGNEEDFATALGFAPPGQSEHYEEIKTTAYAAMLREVAKAFPRLRLIATSLRVAESASVNQWGGLVFDTKTEQVAFAAPKPIAIFDRVGGGDSFASGLLYGLFEGYDLEEALAYAVAHGSLAMTTPGDTAMVTEREVRRLVIGGTARIER